MVHPQLSFTEPSRRSYPARSFKDELIAVWRWARGIPPTSKERFSEEREIERLAKELEAEDPRKR